MNQLFLSDKGKEEDNNASKAETKPGLIVSDSLAEGKQLEKRTTLLSGSAISSTTGKTPNTIEKREGGEPVRDDNYGTYPTKLYELVEGKKWEKAIQRCADHPQEASMCRFKRVDADCVDNQKKKDRSGCSPLALAIILRAPVEVIKALVDAYPNGAKVGDARNMLPLHMAFRLGSSPTTAAVLVCAYPCALTAKDSKGHTPRQILKAYRREYEKKENKGKYKCAMDRNRKDLINHYLGSRKCRYNSRCRTKKDNEKVKDEIPSCNSILSTDHDSSCSESEDEYEGFFSRICC